MRSTVELRTFLKNKLPEYMVPAGFVLLDSFPLTPNGKVDRRALPSPDEARPELDKAFVEFRTPTEELLADIWAQVLGVERVGIYDDFFDLGGHSLLATQVVSRIRETFQVEMPLRRLFETPTVAGLAESLELSRRDRPESSSCRLYNLFLEMETYRSRLRNNDYGLSINSIRETRSTTSR